MIGKLIKKVSPDKNTVIIVWGDNGFHLASPDGMVGKKTLFRHSTATPLIIHYTNVFDRGEKVVEPVESIDILPTIAEITSMNTNLEWDGKTLTKLSNRTWAQTKYTLYGPGINSGYGIAYNGQNPYETFIKFFTSKRKNATSRIIYSTTLVTESQIQIKDIPETTIDYTFSPTESPIETKSPTSRYTITRSPTSSRFEAPTSIAPTNTTDNTLIVSISVSSTILLFVVIFTWYKYNRRINFTKVSDIRLVGH